MFDWGGEFNSYIVPFSPFGEPTVNRGFSPHVRDFIRALADAGGEDAGPGVPPGEPFDENALVEPSDGSLWNDQHGGPRDPQPGNIGGEKRDDVGGPNLHCPCDGVAIIRVVKYVNGQDANVTGPVLTVGDVVTWTYEVTNPGTIAVLFSRLVDDAGTPANPGDDFEPVYVSGDVDGDGFIDAGEVWLFRATGFVKPGRYINLVQVLGVGVNGQDVTDTDAAVYVGSTTELHLAKTVNGVDTHGSPLLVSAGTPLSFSYAVWTTGNVALTVAGVTDDNGTTDTTADDFAAVPVMVLGYNIGDTDRDGRLDPGEIWRYISPAALALLAPSGDYINVGLVEASDGQRTLYAQDTARVHASSAIHIEKLVNGVHAGDAPGLSLLVGTTVVWTYQVTNESGSPLAQVSVVDDNGPGASFAPRYVSGDTHNIGMLDADETWIYTSAGVLTATAVAGLYVNIATVMAKTLTGETVTDDDRANYTGIAPGIDVEKAVNAVDPLHPSDFEDADAATGPQLTIGSIVIFTYLVRSLGGTGVTNVTLKDDNGTAITTDDFSPTYVSGDTDSDSVLDPGEVWLYRFQKTVVTGQYTNIATVTGKSGATTVSDSDAANYYGSVAKILIKKAVNAVKPTAPTAAEDADTVASARILAMGTSLVWTYLVSNLTGTSLKTVVVIDDNGTPNDPSDDFKPVYVSGDSNGNGQLDSRRGVAVHLRRRPHRISPGRPLRQPGPCHGSRFSERARDRR